MVFVIVCVHYQIEKKKISLINLIIIFPLFNLNNNNNNMQIKELE